MTGQNPIIILLYILLESNPIVHFAETATEKTGGIMQNIRLFYRNLERLIMKQNWPSSKNACYLRKRLTAGLNCVF